MANIDTKHTASDLLAIAEGNAGACTTRCRACGAGSLAQASSALRNHCGNCSLARFRFLSCSAVQPSTFCAPTSSRAWAMMSAKVLARSCFR